jgi:hypothetical protein
VLVLPVFISSHATRTHGTPHLSAARINININIDVSVTTNATTNTTIEASHTMLVLLMLLVVLYVVNVVSWSQHTQLDSRILCIDDQ